MDKGDTLFLLTYSTFLKNYVSDDDTCIGLGRFEFFKFGSVFNLRYPVSVFAHHHNEIVMCAHSG